MAKYLLREKAKEDTLDEHNRYISVLAFFLTEMDFGHEICEIAQERDRKARSKKASFTFGRNLQPKAREQNSVTESTHQRSSLDKCQGYRKRDLIITLREQVENDRSALARS